MIFQSLKIDLMQFAYHPISLIKLSKYDKCRILSKVKYPKM